MSSSSPNFLPYLTSDEAAEILKISARTLERMRVEGSGPRFMKAGRGRRSRVLYQLADITAWLEANAYHSTSEFPR
ncbi:MAG: helix-turn-helix domain-containing protein [Alphaproteobacteria bacterium]|nr:helix-turn-helix domain-containing protein [Alphaproteobacteria bacterium]